MDVFHPQPLPATELPRILTLLTDFGTADYYVAAVKGTLLRLAPGTTLIDITHDIAPGDIAAAAFVLAGAAPSFPPGTVHLAVVDPGVGSERRILAAEAAGFFFFAPDNGLLTPFLTGAHVRAIDRDDLFSAGPSQTFHARDRLAPAAAAFLRGEPFTALGLSVLDAVRLETHPPRRSAGELAGRVAHIDRFGNLITNIPNEWLPATCEARVAGQVAGIVARHYAELPRGLPGILPGSLGTLELSLCGENLAKKWGIAIGTAVEIVVHL